MSITTQDLFDGVLYHLRAQGGHGPNYGFDTIKYDGCRCAKGCWMLSDYEHDCDSTNRMPDGTMFVNPKSWWVRAIECTIKRDLTEDEVNMFDELETAYENPPKGRWGYADAETREARPFTTRIPLATTNYFETAAQKIAEQYGLEYKVRIGKSTIKVQRKDETLVLVGK